MNRKAELKMIEEVALRNAIAMFRSLNAKAKSKKASIPEVGIFWIDDRGNMFAESVSLRDAEDYGEFKIFEGSHFESWDKAVRANPSWRGLEYEEIPRGRVVYHKDPKKNEFIVYMPRKSSKHKGKVVARFSLPAGHVRFDFSDDHYQMAAST